MRLHSTAITILALSLATAASAATIRLEAGDYGDAALACAGQPNAGIVSFDGRNFSYPHATKCTDTVTGRSSDVLNIAETCRANGDSSPAQPSTETLKIRLIGAARFQTIHDGRSATYRRCGPLGWFDKH